VGAVVHEALAAGVANSLGTRHVAASTKDAPRIVEATKSVLRTAAASKDTRSAEVLTHQTRGEAPIHLLVRRDWKKARILA
jgi:hypothetical protein